ncbi:MAG TPA: HTTM domain-containing protein [Bryobacteraceae bacterium]|nr:HTTM domain-containing protein [Bryobacteraceae bacterium]
MKLRPLVHAWNAFFFAPQSTTPIALFRIVYGVLLVIDLLFLGPHWPDWYGTHAWVSLATMHAVEPGTRLSLFAVMPQSDVWVWAVFWISLGSAVLLTFGFLTRMSSVAAFLCLTSIHQRNLYITHSGDTFLRVSGFFLMFAPAGAAFSMDRLIGLWRGRGDSAVRLRSPWAQRMIQIELALMYFAAFCSKAQGHPWVDGTALFYVFHLDELRRFPLPAWFFDSHVLKLGTWSVLALEFSLGILIWIRDLRYYVLACGLVFHLAIEYSMNIPLFEWDILAAYILFIDASDIARARKRVSAFVRERLLHAKRAPVNRAIGVSRD